MFEDVWSPSISHLERPYPKFWPSGHDFHLNDIKPTEDVKEIKYSSL